MQISLQTWPAVSALLDEALALPVQERATWVESLQGEHAALKDTLRELLARADGLETEDFLATLPRFTRLSPGSESGQLTELAAGESIGPYRLISELGTGGMGAVWLAERADGSLKRKVALKLPRLVWAKGLAERMARERDILASLEHPNIARLYDAGVDQHGRPYLALEYVEGQPIDVYAKERGLGVKDKLQLLLQVCSAVAFAHSRLVVHRDLKPSNILVTGDGQVRLLDFGIAKLMEGDSAKETQLTQLAGRALTLDYASPEQIKGEPIGTASDVYSLGVVAYELLTGAQPYRLKRGSAAELEEAIVAADIQRPSASVADASTRRVLRGDLDAIVLKSLAQNIAERYETVSAFAEDLRHHLSGEAVVALREPWIDRVGRVARRRPVESTVVAGLVLAVLGGLYAQAAIMLALALGTGVALWQRNEALRERDNVARERAAAQRAAEHARQEAATALAVQEFIESVFAFNSGDQARPSEGRETTARDLLDRGAARIASELHEAPQARLHMLSVLAKMYEDLNEFARQRELQALRVSLARELNPRGDELVLALADDAHALAISGREVEARARLDEADEVLSQGDHSTEARFRVALRRASVHRGDDEARALREAEHALNLARAVPESQDLILALYLAAEGRYSAGKAATADPLLVEGIARVEANLQLGASVLAPLYALRGEVQLALDNAELAETCLRRAVQIEADRGNQGVTPHYVALKLAALLNKQQRWSESLSVLHGTVEWANALASGYETTAPIALSYAAQATLNAGDAGGALILFDRAVQLAAGLQDAPDVVPRIALFRAEALIALGRLDEAESEIANAERVILARFPSHAKFIGPPRQLLSAARGAKSPA